MTQTQKIPIKYLTLLENNPRKISKEQFAKLCKSLQEDPSFFDLRPCLVNYNSETKEHIVYAGNQRVLAAKKLKWGEVPAIIEKDLSEEIMKKRVAKDNQHYGTWDFDILANSFEIDDLLDAGFTMDQLHLEVEDLGETEAPEDKAKKLKMCPSCGHEF